MGDDELNGAAGPGVWGFPSGSVCVLIDLLSDLGAAAGDPELDFARNPSTNPAAIRPAPMRMFSLFAVVLSPAVDAKYIMLGKLLIIKLFSKSVNVPRLHASHK